MPTIQTGKRSRAADGRIARRLDGCVMLHAHHMPYLLRDNAVAGLLEDWREALKNGMSES